MKHSGLLGGVAAVALLAGTVALPGTANALWQDIFSEAGAAVADGPGPGSYGGTGLAVEITNPPDPWAGSITGVDDAVWISYADTGDPTVPGGLTTDDTTEGQGATSIFTEIVDLTGESQPHLLDLTVFADDTARVQVTGSVTGALPDIAGLTAFFTLGGACVSSPIGCIDENGGQGTVLLAAGEEWTVDIEVYQLGGDGFGTMYGGTVHAVPIPGAVWLFGSGVLGLLGIGYTRRRKATA